MPSILALTADRFERVLAWARYLHWADVHRRHFDAWMEADHDINDDCRGWEFIALLSAWHASLWVVVEAWREVPLSDPEVDELLESAPRYLELLRRYRNGVFHYQPRLIEKRLVDFLSLGDAAIHWSHLLHEEFSRFYWELIEKSPFPEDLRPELRRSIIAMVGWIPDDIPVAQAESLRRRAREAMTMLRDTGDFSSSAAGDLVEAVRHSVTVAADTERAFQEWKAQMLERIKREGRTT